MSMSTAERIPNAWSRPPRRVLTLRNGRRLRRQGLPSRPSSILTSAVGTYGFWMSAPRAAVSDSAPWSRKYRLEPFPELCQHPSLSSAAGRRESVVVRVDLDELCRALDAGG